MDEEAGEFAAGIWAGLAVETVLIKQVGRSERQAACR
jgi:hypothetical protein